MKRSMHSEGAPTMRPKAFMFKRLIQAALLAAVLVPFGSIAVEGEQMYFFCSNEFGGCEAGGEGTTATWDFGTYYLSLMFDMNSGGQIGVDVTANVISGEAFAAKAAAFPGYTCLAVTQTGECVEFAVDPFIGTAGDDWTHYTIEIGWEKIAGQDLEAARMTLLVNRDALPNDGTVNYDYDVCATSALYDACFINPDPLIRSGDTDFSHWTPSYRPASAVPEPSTLLLLGAGVTATAFRRRRGQRHL